MPFSAAEGHFRAGRKEKQQFTIFLWVKSNVEGVKDLQITLPFLFRSCQNVTQKVLINFFSPPWAQHHTSTNCPKKCCLAESCDQSNLIDLQPRLGWSQKWGLAGWGQLGYLSSLYPGGGFRHLAYTDTVTWVKLSSTWGRSPPAFSQFFALPERWGDLERHFGLAICICLFASSFSPPEHRRESGLSFFDYCPKDRRVPSSLVSNQ